MEALSEESECLGLRMSWIKTKIQAFNDLLGTAISSVSVCGESVDLVERFTYLGSDIHVFGDSSYEIGNTELQEKQEVIDVIANSSMTLLYPVVLILVHISLPESTPFSKKLDEPSAIRRLAKEAKHRNILVYGLLVNYTKSSTVVKWECYSPTDSVSCVFSPDNVELGISD
ncbi:ISPD cytidylyltransferase, partial [Polypterus senegalus]